MRVLVPTFFADYVPWPGTPWDRMTVAAQSYPDRIVAIGSVFNGAGIMFNPVYDFTYRNFRNAGGKLIGYVYSSYGLRPIADVKAEIDNWFVWYGVDGVFIDEMDNVAGANESYYQEIHDHVQAHLATAIYVGNPRKPTVPSYLPQSQSATTPALCIYEDNRLPLRWTADSWVFQLDRQHFAALLYGVSDAKWQHTVDHAWDQNCGFIYVTDDNDINPWDSLPQYFEEMVRYVDMAY